tara:strand:+ start:1603 stop:2244 length:642 start_codon:yes stop_codon:yes gene_type:complete
MSFTYTTLKQAIQDYAENNETTFVNNLDNFIKAAEERILKEVDLEFFRKNVTANMTSGNKFLVMPTDFLSSFSLSYVDSSGENIFLLQKDVNFLQEFHPNPSTTGAPKYYGIFDYQNFILAPTPNSSYSAELHYYYRPASIVGAGTTWIGTNAPQALLYGALVEAYIFMKGEQDVIQLYNGRLQEAINDLQIYAVTKENTDAYRSGLLIKARA